MSVSIRTTALSCQPVVLPTVGYESKYIPPIVTGRHENAEYFPTLDGWRALAVFGVIAFHCAKSGFIQNSILSKVAARGNTGVDIFFALSGFLICGKLLQEQRFTSTIDLRRFYLRRSFRILPALALYLVALAALAGAGWIKASGWEFSSTALFLRNYFPLFSGDVLGRYTAHFWSLAVEEHFYLLWPPIMLLLGPKLRRLGLVALTLALAVFVWRTIDSHYGWLTPFGSGVEAKTDTRIDALLWGCLAAIVYPYIHPRVRAWSFGKNIWFPVAFVLAAVLILHQVPGGSLIKAILFPALVISTAISPNSVLGRLLEFRLLKWAGRLSYSIYIWQELLIVPAGYSHSPMRSLQHFPINIGFIFLFAAGSYYLVEQPLIRIGRWLGNGVQSAPSMKAAVI